MDTDVIHDLRVKLDLATEALRKAQERALAGQFALEVMHEIRNPLEAIGYLLYLAQTEEDHEAVRVHLRQVNEQMTTIHQIAAQTLGFARSFPTALETDLIELAEAALRIHQRRITAQKIHLVRDFSEMATAEMYTGEILQVVSNLWRTRLTPFPRVAQFPFGSANGKIECSCWLPTADTVCGPSMSPVCLNRSSQRNGIAGQDLDWPCLGRSLSATEDTSVSAAAFFLIEVEQRFKVTIPAQMRTDVTR